MRPFVGWAVEYVASYNIGGRHGWSNQLDAYEWKGADAAAGLQFRGDFNRDLAEAKDEDQLLEVIDAVADWGGMAELEWEQLEEIARSFEVLDHLRGGGENWTDLFAGRIATSSKAYAMYDPQLWAIYDSRVAAALAKLVDRWWADQGATPDDGLLLFGQPPGRVKRDDLPPGFPHLAPGDQSRLNFLYASWLMRCLGNQITETEQPGVGDDGGVQHVEMTFFMLGNRGVSWPTERSE